MNIGHLPVGEPQADEDHVLNSLLDVTLSVRGDNDRLFVQKIKDHRKIMGRKRQEGVLVMSNHTEIDPLRIDIVNLPDFPGGDHLLQAIRHRMVEQQMAHHQNPFSLFCDLHQLRGMVGAQGHGLFHEDIPVCQKQFLRQGVV